MALAKGTRVRNADRRIGTVTVDSSNISALVRFDGSDDTESIMLSNLDQLDDSQPVVTSRKYTGSPDQLETIDALVAHYTGKLGDEDQASIKVGKILKSFGWHVDEITTALRDMFEARDTANQCEGHESLNGAHMGQAVYCDGSCQS